MQTGEERMSLRKQYGNQNVYFETILEVDQAATAAAGHTKYKEVEILIVQNGGDKTPVEVTEQHRKEYAAQYEAFKAKQEQPIDGTPLSEWALIPRTAVQELAQFGIRSIEQLAEVNGEVRKKIGTLDQFVKKAKAWIKEVDSDRTKVLALQDQKEKLETKMQAMQDEIVRLRQRVEAAEGINLSANN